MKRDTHAVGDNSVAQILARLVSLGYDVSIPFSGGSPYDLIVDDNGTLLRVQCKTARLISGVVQFNCYSVDSKNKKIVLYDGKADIFLAYCPQNQKVYKMGVAEAPKGAVSLRVSPPLNNQTTGIRWARDYEL